MVMVHRVAESLTRLKRLSTHTHKLEPLSVHLPPPYTLPRLLKSEELDPLCVVPKKGILQAVTYCPRVGAIWLSLKLASSSGLFSVVADFP